ncbi:MAG: 3-dehydroquinate synthase [Thermoplasmata archaeon]
METINLNLEGRTCRIHIGKGILGSVGEAISRESACRRFAVITNPTIRSIYGKDVARSLESAGLEHIFIDIPDSEGAKSLDVANDVYGALTENGFDRDSCIIGLGGGVVGDLAGFAAATYMRGIDLIHIPTTLLSQVDSAIGGKTAVNTPRGKNLVGAFHQPAMVISDVMTLDTLPDTKFRSGAAEVVKYGMALDGALFNEVEESADSIRKKDHDVLVRIISRCGSIKARIVEEDERDRGSRMILNFGHTLGHALESASGHQYRHGEAVSLGMVFASRLAVSSGMLAAEELERLIALLSAFCLPCRIEMELDSETIMKFMGADKKSAGGRLRLVLPTRVGSAVISDEIGRDEMAATLEAMRV